MSLRLTTVALAMAFGLASCSGSIGQKGERPADDGTGDPGNPSSMPGKDPKGGGTKTPGTGSGMGDPGAMTPLPPVGSSPLEPDRTSAHCKVVSPGPAPVRRLSRAEYDNTIKD